MIIYHTSRETTKVDYRLVSIDMWEDGVDALKWLSEKEQAEVARFRNVSRQRQFLIGRYAAKSLLLDNWQVYFPDSCWKPLPGELQISTCNAKGSGIAPTVSTHGQTERLSLSICHGTRTAIAAIIRSREDENLRIGVDLCEASSRSRFGNLFWMTPDEIERSRKENNCVSARLHWSFKEAVYKAVNNGEAFVPAEINLETIESVKNRLGRDEIDARVTFFGTPVQCRIGIVPYHQDRIVFCIYDRDDAVFEDGCMEFEHVEI